MESISIRRESRDEPVTPPQHLESTPSEQQLQPQTQDGRCAYALSVEARQPQGTLTDGGYVFLRSSDDLYIRSQQRPRRYGKIVESLEPILVA